MKKMMQALMASAVAVAAMAPVAAHAGSADGKIQVKVLGTAVLPNGKSDDVAAVYPGNNSKASDNIVPTVAVEYFFTPNVSVETICCLTEHHVTGTGPDIGGAELAKNVLILPATVTVKYHLPLGPVKPYIGAGPSVFFFLKDKVGADLADVTGVDKLTIKDKFGAVLQAGVDIPVNDQGLSLSLDAKRYFMRPTAHFYKAGVDTLDAKVKLDPWVLSAGVAYRF